MKLLFLFFIISVCVLLAVSQENTRGCVYIMGICKEECPVGTTGYSSSCIAPTWSQKTCSSPEPYDMGAICDLSRCDCDEPTVLDEATGKCVKLENCTPPTLPKLLG